MCYHVLLGLEDTIVTVIWQACYMGLRRYYCNSNVTIFITIGLTRYYCNSNVTNVLPCAFGLSICYCNSNVTNLLQGAILL